MDPLHQLRECTRTGQTIVFDEVNRPNEILFNGVYHQSDQPTRFKSKKGKGPAYSLGSVWFFWKNYVQNEKEKEVDHGSYMRECKNIGVSHVSLVDRAELIAWFKESDSMDVVSHLPDPVLTVTSDVAEPVLKKMKMTDEREVESNVNIIPDATPTSTIPEPDKSKLNLSSESGLTEDQIESVKQKLRERKKSSVVKPASTIIEKSYDPIGDMDVADDYLERTKNETIVKDIIQREKPLSSYQSILQAPMQKPFTYCLKMATTLAQKEEKERDKQKSHQQRQASKAKAPQQGHNRYEKIDENEYWKERNMAINDFQLDTRGTFEGMQLDNIGNPIHLARKESAHIITPSIPSSTPTTKPVVIGGGSIPSQPRKRAYAEIEQSNDGKFRVIDKPIIIVPGRSTLSSLLNLNNAKQFLSESTFVNPLDIKDGSKMNKLEIEYTAQNGNSIKFLIVDNVSELRSKDWGNVIAIFAQGQEWQFKQYPKDWGGVAGIFSHAKGFYMHYEDEKVPKNVASWNVKALSVNKVKRHHDGTAARKFWEDIDLELRKRNFIK
jgi:hypothetical protein